jgi:hypothetical protein
MWAAHNGPEGRYRALESVASGEFVIRSRTFVDEASTLEKHTHIDDYLHDPQLTLSRIEAERAILAEHDRGDASVERDEGDCRTCSAPTHGFSGMWPVDYPCTTVLALARGWGWKENPDG